jgi:putative ATP-dependent DNA helicase
MFEKGATFVSFGDGPLIVQSDKTCLLEISHPQADAARAALSPFAELEKAPEHVHTYRITPLALWNARAAGFDAEQVVDVLETYSKFPVPQSLLVDTAETMSRYGRLRLQNHPTQGLILETTERTVLEEVSRHRTIAGMLGARIDDDTFSVPPSERGRLKQELLKVGWPVEDLAGYVDGEAHPISLSTETVDWQLRDYQSYATESFWEGGSGIVVLPCGAGKTMVGAATMAKAQATTLILVTSTIAGRQWRDELIRRTSLQPAEIGEYSGEKKEIKPVTIATYQVVTRKTKGEYRALELFDSRDWGLIIYDEVHLLPAPVFRMSADLQSRRRLGLTATLIREDGREGDVFSLIGPKRYDAPWKELESQGFIATAECIEVRADMPSSEKMEYATASSKDRYRLAACSQVKFEVVDKILNKHSGKQTLLIGAYLDQLQTLARRTGAPLIDGRTSAAKREKLFAQFRTGEITTLVVSKVANFSIDLPDTAVVVQVSGTFGSRQEEAQRLGRLLRPKSTGEIAYFYTVVTRDTVDATFALHRQRFLAEQGYAYRLVDADDIPSLGMLED